MSTAAYVKRVTGQTGTGPVLYRDQIMDAGFVGHFDFISDYVKNGNTAAALPNGATVRSLVKNGASASPETAGAAAFTGGLDTKGIKFATLNNKLKLPDAFKLPTTSKRFALCVWAAYETALGALPAAGAAIGLVGYAYQTGTQNQYAISFVSDANQKVTSLRGMVNGFTVAVTDATILAKVADGAMHQYALDAEAITNDTQWRLTLFMDGAQIGQSIVTTGALNDPATGAQASVAGPYLGQVGGFGQFYGHYGRVWLKRFSLDATNRATADIVAQEWAAYGADYV